MLDEAYIRHSGESRNLVRFGRPVAFPVIRGGWVYIMTNRPRGRLYTGVAADLVRRVAQHRRGEGSAFCRKYNLTRLAYMERHEEISDAIAREKAIKEWNRAWKIELIEGANPNWDDLWDSING